MLNMQWQPVTAAAITLSIGTMVAADETTLCNFYVRSVPYTITTQGHYCFDRNLSTAMTSGNAITINADYVVLDLNHFKLGGGAAGEATEAYGVVVLDRRNVVVRNGIVRGFYVGISLHGMSSVVENNILDGNLLAGIFLGGVYNVAEVISSRRQAVLP